MKPLPGNIRSGFLAIAFFSAAVESGGALPITGAAAPDVVFGSLYSDVERAGIFPDQKTFADAIPTEAPEAILESYRAAEQQPNFSLRLFVARHFIIPKVSPLAVPDSANIEEHLSTLWSALERSVLRRDRSSLLPLPRPYVVPGGRFQELYYWDSYFTMLGLRESGREDLVESMVDDFAWELENYGLIPNGNRSYYLSRSQPPFFALMVEFVAEREGRSAYRKYRTALLAEHAYWNDEVPGTQHVVTLRDGSRLTRFFDRATGPRAEAFETDEDTRKRAASRSPEIFRDIRAAAESGWDFSSRWFSDGMHLATIDTTSIVPVDLNALLVQLDRTLATADEEVGDKIGADAMRQKSEIRIQVLREKCWSGAAGFFLDYNLRTGRQSPAPSLAGLMPLFLKLATKGEADAVSEKVERSFLRPGGVVSTLSHTGQQWDAPNGWAPLEWITIQGLRNYSHERLAKEIAERWMRLNVDVYRRTGRMMEKYNVEDLTLTAGGGEYVSQDGFGWTNGVLLKLMATYNERLGYPP